MVGMGNSINQSGNQICFVCELVKSLSTSSRKEPEVHQGIFEPDLENKMATTDHSVNIFVGEVTCQLLNWASIRGPLLEVCSMELK